MVWSRTRVYAICTMITVECSRSAFNVHRQYIRAVSLSYFRAHYTSKHTFFLLQLTEPTACVCVCVWELCGLCVRGHACARNVSCFQFLSSFYLGWFFNLAWNIKSISWQNKCLVLPVRCSQKVVSIYFPIVSFSHPLSIFTSTSLSLHELKSNNLNRFRGARVFVCTSVTNHGVFHTYGYKSQSPV